MYPIPATAGPDLDPVRWVVAVCEPRLPSRTRTGLEAEVRTWCAREPKVAAWWFGGLVWSVVGTLPSRDPWTMLSARDQSGAVLTVEGVNPPPTVGAVGPLGVFGTWRDGVDLAGPPESADPRLEVHLAALAEPLPAPSAALLAFAVHGPDVAAGVLLRGGQTMSIRDHGEQVFDVAEPALRWALWRRACYVATGESYPVEEALRWVTRARDAAAGREWDRLSAGYMVDDVERVDENQYRTVVPQVPAEEDEPAL